LANARIIAYLFMIIGALLLVTYAAWDVLQAEFTWEETSKNTVLVLGTGAAFLGIYAAAMSTERYVKAEALAAGCSSVLDNLNRIMTELNVNGNAVYLPASYAGEPRIFIPAKEGSGSIPDLRGDPTFLTGTTSSQLGLLISPLGHRLCQLLESELKAGLESLEPGAVASMVPPLLSQGLGLAASVDLDEEGMTCSIRSSVCSDQYRSGLRAAMRVGCPVASCMIEALARSENAAIRILSLAYDAQTDTAQIRLGRAEE